MGIESIGQEVASLESTAKYVPEVWDEENPSSLVSCLTESLALAAKQGREKDPELYALDEHEIFFRLERQRRAPTPTLNRMRAQLWIAFENARTRNLKIEMHEICAGICSTAALKQALTDPLKGAWLFTPPERYTDMLDETLQYGMKKMRAILDMDDLKPSGAVDVKLLELKFKIVAMMDLRKHGAPTQKIQQQNMNMNLTRTEKDVTGLSLEELEARAADLRKQNLIAQNLPPAVVARLTEAPVRVPKPAKPYVYDGPALSADEEELQKGMWGNGGQLQGTQTESSEPEVSGGPGVEDASGGISDAEFTEEEQGPR